MYRSAALVLLLVCGIGFQVSHGTEVEVKDKDGKLCIYANLMINFTVTYEVTGNKTETAEFELPDSVTTEGSDCGDTSSMLKLDFGEGHSWSVNFTKAEKTYKGELITFSYNLNDSTTFPNSASNETVSIKVMPQVAPVSLDACYSCRSEELIQTGGVRQTLWDVVVQAFVVNGTKSNTTVSCPADLPTTAPTTVAPNTTTAAPPTTTPTPALDHPTTGKYRVGNQTVCLMADFGLRIGLVQGQTVHQMNFDPNGTVVNGTCGGNSSELVLMSTTMTIVLTFTNDQKKFHLQALNITGNTTSGVSFSESNTNLTMWEATVGSSYMCNKEQNFTISTNLTIYTFDLRVQPFEVKKNNFSTAEECFLDSDLSFLVPIAVGVALSFLIILVLISYLIGRRKSRTGYQSV